MECSKCGDVKKAAAFATFRTRAGELRRRGICLKCRGEYHHDNFETLQAWRKEYNAKTKSRRQEQSSQRKDEARKFVDDFKDRPCADCGVKWPPVAMDLDHVRGSKCRSVSGLVGSGYNLDLIRIEIEKCEVVCACCHRLRTARRKENLAPNQAKLVGRKPTASRGKTLVGELPSLNELPFAVKVDA